MKRLVYIAIFLSVFSVYLWQAIDGGLSAPPEAGDAPDYDAIAFNLWRLRGYGYDWNDPEWRQPYLAFPEYQSLLIRHSGYYPTTYRPPALPISLSVVYALTRRSFAAWRILNCLIVSGAVTLAAAISARLAGMLAAVLTAVLVLLSPDLTFYSHMLVTEGMAAFFVTLLAWRWLRNSETGWTLVSAIPAGLVLGLLVLTRSIFVLWLPVGLLIPARAASSRTAGASVMRLKLIALAVSLAVVAPWWIRNVIVLDAFMPLGTQAAINLPAGFGPRALRHEGTWVANSEDGAPEVEAQRLDPVTSEVLLARFRSRLTFKWAQEHPLDVPRLMALHIWQEVRPRGTPAGWFLPVAAVSAFVFRRGSAARILALIVLANFFSIAMTWSVGGRFMVPLHPLLAALAAGLLAAIARYLVSLDAVAASNTARPGA